VLQTSNLSKCFANYLLKFAKQFLEFAYSLNPRKNIFSLGGANFTLASPLCATNLQQNTANLQQMLLPIK